MLDFNCLNQCYQVFQEELKDIVILIAKLIAKLLHSCSDSKHQKLLAH